MHKFTSFNHEILPAKDIKISAISSAGLYGKGVFTTIAIYNSKAFLWNKHWSRLKDHAKKLDIDLSEFDENEVHKSLDQIVKKNDITQGRSRITFFDESSDEIWQSSTKLKTSLLIQTDDQRKKGKNLSVNISTRFVNSLSPLVGIKSSNYLENIIALREAKADKFDEGIRYNERNKVVSFCMGNIVWLENNDEKLYTPSRKTGCLAGTTRELIMENFEVVEVEKDIDEFCRDVEMIFITSSGLGIAQVTDFESKKISTNSHALTKFIQTQLSKL